jgi:signal transduction histidine kinase
VGSFSIANVADWMALAVFVASCTMISFVCEAMHRARTRAVAAEEQAKVAVEREEAMAALQRSAEQLRELSQRLTFHVDNSPVAVIEWGPDMRSILSLVLDVTERQQAETALVAASAANVAKSQFLANVSHELRTPMNAILGMIDVALPKAVDPTVQDCLQTANGSADLLLTLLNDLLDSAKIESGKLELEAAPFSLRRMLDQITRVLAVRASEKGLCFYCRMPDEIPDAVVGDRMRLQQVLLNLAGNAVKFTERGGVEIDVRVVEEGDGDTETRGRGNFIRARRLRSPRGADSPRGGATFARGEAPGRGPKSLGRFQNGRPCPAARVASPPDRTGDAERRTPACPSGGR